MAIQWLRLWHEMPNDPKWRTIARASKQPISAVIAVYLHLLVAASSNATERGRTESVCIEDVASALDLETEQIEQIMAAMQGRVLDGETISGWDKRQVEREDGSAARAKAWREAKKLEKGTNANAPERKQTPDKDKDKDKEISPIPPDGGSLPGKGKSAISLATFLSDCKKSGVKPIPDDDPVFSYAEKVQLPAEFLALQWREFKDRYQQPDAKRYKAWSTVFLKSVKANWFKLWFLGNDGNYALTTTGQQAQRNHQDAS